MHCPNISAERNILLNENNYIHSAILNQSDNF